MNALESIIDDQPNESVGGSQQLAWMTSAGFEVVARGEWPEDGIFGIRI